MLGDENLVRIVVISNNLILPDSMENMLDPRRFVLETITPHPNSISGAQVSSPDIFVIDSMNSGGDVLSLCQKIRHYGKTPIMVLAATHKPELVEQVLDAGADEFLIKPVSGSILTAYLNTLTRRARAERDAALLESHNENGNCQQTRLLSYK